MKHVHMVAVESSNVVAVGYDAEASELRVKFTSGALYGYADVPGAVYGELLAAESVGQFIAQQVKTNYKAELLDDQQNLFAVLEPAKVLCPGCGRQFQPGKSAECKWVDCRLVGRKFKWPVQLVELEEEA